MSRTLLSRIKPRFSTSHNAPPPDRALRRLVGAVSDVLTAQTPSWEDDLDSLFADSPRFSVPDVLARIADPGACLKLFRWAARLGWIDGPADAAACSSVLKVLAWVRDLPEIERVWARMAEAGVFPTKEAWEAAVRAFSDAGLVEKALDLYELGKKELNDVPGTFTCNALLNALVKRRQIGAARQVYDEMREREQGDNYTTFILVRGYCKEGQVEEGRMIIEDRWGRRCVPDVIFYNILMDGYYSAGDVQKAYVLFDKMKLEGFLPTLASMHFNSGL